MLSLGGNANNGDNKLAGTHDSGAIDKELTATKFLHHVKRGRSGCNVNNACDGRDQERILDAHLQEESGAIVDLKLVSCRDISLEFKLTDEVDASPLLEHLQASSHNHSVEISTARHATFEAVGPGSARNLLFILEVGFNLCKLCLDSRVCSGLTTNSLQGTEGIFHPTTFDVVARGLRQEEKPNGENRGPDELHTNGDTI